MACGQNAPLFTLPSQTVIKLDELLLEGDSLEVSLDETLHIGRILQVREDDEFILLFLLDNAHLGFILLL